MKKVQLRRGSYVDSVTLMQVSRRVAGLDGVSSALVAMATDLNLDLALGMGFEVADASPNELLVAVDATDGAALDVALAEVDAALAEASRPVQSGFGSAPEPVTVRAAAAARPEATVALISTPGQYAFADAVDAVDAGLLTMVFSDNVPLEQEVALKEYADARRRAGDGTRLRHRRRRRGGARLRERRAPRAGRHRRRLRHRRPAPDVPARRGRGRASRTASGSAAGTCPPRWADARRCGRSTCSPPTRPPSWSWWSPSRPRRPSRRPSASTPPRWASRCCSGCSAPGSRT